MVKIKFDTAADNSKVDAAENFIYLGPKPTGGVYPVILKRMVLKTNKNGDPMLSGIAEIQAKKSDPRARFNGYAIFWNQNVTNQGAKYINAFLDALGLSRKRFWENGLITDGEAGTGRAPAVTRICGKDPEGMTSFVGATMERSEGYQERLSIKSWLTAAQLDEASIDDEDDEDEPYEDEEMENTELDEEDSDEDDDEEEWSDEEE